MATSNPGRFEPQRRRSLLGLAAFIACLAAALCGAGSALAASGGSERLQVTPVKALGSKAITIKWRTDRAPRPGRRYRVVVQVSGEGGACTNYAESADLTSWKKGRTVTTTLRARGNSSARAWWCSGLATARVVATSGAFATVLARTYFQISSDHASPTPTTRSELG